MANDISSSDASKKPTLIQLWQEHANIVRDIVESSGEDVSETQANQLNIAMMALCEKADAYGHVQMQLEQFLEACKKRREEWQAGERSAKRAVDSLKERMRYVLTHIPENKLSGEEFCYYLTKPSLKLEIDETKIPKEYMKAVVTFQVDKEKIEMDLNKGANIPGVSKVETRQLRSKRP